MNWIVTPGPTPNRSMAMKNETVTVGQHESQAGQSEQVATVTRGPPSISQAAEDQRGQHGTNLGDVAGRNRLEQVGGH